MPWILQVSHTIARVVANYIFGRLATDIIDLPMQNLPGLANKVSGVGLKTWQV
jgi:hypothetical protein